MNKPYYIIDTSVFMNLEEHHPLLWNSDIFQELFTSLVQQENVIILEKVRGEIFNESKSDGKKTDAVENFFANQLRDKNFYKELVYIKYLGDVTRAYEMITGKAGEDRKKSDYISLNNIADPYLIACGLFLKNTTKKDIFIVSEEKRAASDNGVKKLHKVKIPNVCGHEIINLPHLSLAEFLWHTIFSHKIG